MPDTVKICSVVELRHVGVLSQSREGPWVAGPACQLEMTRW